MPAAAAVRTEVKTIERYQQFLEAFLSVGPRFSAVARQVGTDPASAKRVWEKGWPDQPFGVPIHRHYGEALRRLERRKQASVTTVESGIALRQNGAPPCQLSDRESAQNPPLTPAELLTESAIDAMQSEVDILEAFRSNLISAVLVSNGVVRGFEAMALGVAECMRLEAENVTAMTPDRLLKPLEKWARITGMLVTSAKQVMEMQRLLVGAPQAIIENRGRTDDASDPDEKMARITRLLDTMRRHGLIAPEAPPEASEYKGEASDPGDPETPAVGELIEPSKP